MKRALLGVGIAMSWAIAVAGGSASSSAHADGLDDFDVGGVIGPFDVLGELGVWEPKEEPPASAVEEPSSSEAAADPAPAPVAEAGAPVVQPPAAPQTVAIGLPATGGGTTMVVGRNYGFVEAALALAVLGLMTLTFGGAQAVRARR